MNINLKGYTAVVCGSTQGIGRAIATQMAAAGADIILLARNEEKLKSVISGLDVSAGQKHSFRVADFADTASVKRAAADVATSHTVHILVNNTGGPPAGAVATAKEEEFLIAFNGHLINNHNLVQAFVPGMKEAGYGRIINIISTSVKIPLKGLGVSNTIRGAVANWSKTMANELASSGITVNNILPGATETERLGNIIQNKAGKTGLDSEEITKEMLDEIPAGRFGKPEEPAYAAVFLASNYASYITGTNVVVDGGRTGNL